MNQPSPLRQSIYNFQLVNFKANSNHYQFMAQLYVILRTYDQKGFVGKDDR